MAKLKTENLKALKSTWYVWLFPVFAIIISLWLFAGYFQQQGAWIEIRFEDASSLQPEKTQIRFRGVTIGVVRRVTVSEDSRSAVAHVQLQRAARQFAREGAKFWVVVPKVDLQGISGLETIFQGTYISALPGEENSPEKYEFRGRIGGESQDPLEDTSVYFLEASNVGSLGPGDPITFRGLNIGSVTQVTLSKDARKVHVQINVQNRYVRLIRTNTVFWRKLAVHADLGLFGAEVKIGSLESLMKGGIDLFTPTEAGPQAKALARFDLLAEPPKNWEKWNPEL